MFESSDPIVAEINDSGEITAKSVGTSVIEVSSTNVLESLEVQVIDNRIQIENWGIYSEKETLLINETTYIHGYIDDFEYKYLEEQITFEIVGSNSIARLEGNKVTANSLGDIIIVGKLMDLNSQAITIKVIDSGSGTEPDPDPPIGDNVSIVLSVDKTLVALMEYFTFTIEISPIEYYSVTQIHNVSGYSYTFAASKTEFYFAGLEGIDGGTSTFAAKCVDKSGVEHVSNEISVSWGTGGEIPKSVSLTPDYEIFAIGETITLNIETDPTSASKKLSLECLNDSNAFKIEFNNITALKEGTFQVQGEIEGVKSNIVELTVVKEDPYVNIDVENFYKNYKIAENEIDAYLRTKHYLLSGDITPQDQKPTIASSQLRKDNYLIHNSTQLYSNDGDTYYLLDSYGEIVKEIYKVGAYVSLEDVAAYVYAFGDVPINYDLSVNSPIDSPWREYLRKNHKTFSGDINIFPYEPVLPRIFGCDGDLVYYEIDIGTTGTDCDPNYPNRIYNDGYTISRGAARIVYSRYYTDETSTMKDNLPVTDLNDRYVFYSYNHYNDFQEYLNYENGWGEIFGNKTAGNNLNQYNPSNPPSPYIDTIRKDLRSF